MNFRSQKAIIGSLFVAVCFSCFAPAACLAQKKYQDPYADEVVRIADKAAEYLNTVNKGKIGDKTVCALALLEYHKRYDGVVPTDNPMIKRVVTEVAEMVDARSAEVLDARETYFPSLALILLAEYDVKKYKKQIVTILDALVARQMEVGAFTYKDDQDTDTSQSQFGALAFFVARQHRIPLDPKHVRKLLQFYVDYQAQSGTWSYQAKMGEGDIPGTNSIHSASLSSVYLLADLLRLSPRVKNMSSSSVDTSLGLPKNVTVYVAAFDDEDVEIEEAWGDGVGPVVSFNKGKLQSCKRAGAAWYSNRFEFPIPQWNSYFMYALERYAYFKEQADGSVGGALSSWYDDGVDYLAEYQNDAGGFEGHRRVAVMQVSTNTALSMLFLVRASEIISLPPVDSELGGGEGFDEGMLTQSKTGVIASSEAEKSLSDLIDALSDGNLEDQQLAQITAAMKRAVREFKASGDKSRGEVTSFLKTMISDKNYFRRLVAIKFLSGEQDMDNVPALLYAMGDPDPAIAIQAHNGLRLISRKFDTLVFEDRGNKDDNLLELQRLKQQWTRWFLEIRPDAELLE